MLMACDPVVPTVKVTTEVPYDTVEMEVDGIVPGGYIIADKGFFGTTLYTVDSALILEIGDTVYVRLYEDTTIELISKKVVVTTTEEITTEVITTVDTTPEDIPIPTTEQVTTEVPTTDMPSTTSTTTEVTTEETTTIETTTVATTTGGE